LTLDLVGALAQVFTAIVISATAIAALVQLRHMRGSNQIATMARFETLDTSPEVEASKQFVLGELDQRMQDPVFRSDLEANSLRGDARKLLPVLNLFEQMGNYVRHGYIDRDFVLDQYSGQITTCWEKMKSALPYVRAAQGASVGVWFEYLAALSEEYFSEHRDSDYPNNVRRMRVDSTFFDADHTGKTR
jgi:hypothetical protein